MLKRLSIFVFAVSLLKFCLQDVSSLPPLQCNCVRAKDCVPHTIQLINSHIAQGIALNELFRYSGCGFSAFTEPMICCPTRMDSYDFANHHHLKYMKDRWIWDRRPLTNNERLHGIDMENKFINMNFIDDYVDRKTHRNCPPILFKETKHSFHKNFRGHHDDHAHNLHHFHHHPTEHLDHFNKHEGNVHAGSNHKPAELPKPQEPRLMSTTTSATIPKQSTPRTRPTLNSTNCGVTLNKRIIGGIEALPGEFPWITRIAYLNRTDNSIAYRCSGSFVTELHILTAAHCVANLDTSLSLSHVRLVDSRTNNDCNNENMPCQESSNQFEIAETIIHPSFDNPMRANDIAIIRITKPNNTEVNYGTICLPNPSQSNLLNSRLIGNTGIVAGWSNNDGTDTNDLQVRYIRLAIINNTDCAESYNAFREGFAEKITIVPSMVCTQGQSNGTDVCRGDSGGPLMDDSESNRDGRYTLLGIVAFGPICGLTNLLPGVYMRISEYVDWIISSIER